MKVEEALYFTFESREFPSTTFGKVKTYYNSLVYDPEPSIALVLPLTIIIEVKEGQTKKIQVFKVAPITGDEMYLINYNLVEVVLRPAYRSGRYGTEELGFDLRLYRADNVLTELLKAYIG